MIVVVAAGAGLAAAQPLYTLQQDRRIEAHSISFAPEPVETGGNAAAPDYEVWQDVVAARSAFDPGILWSAVADQHSAIESSGVTAFGSAELGLADDPFGVSLSASNVYRVRFALARPTTIDLLGHLFGELTVPAFSGGPWDLALQVSARLNQVAGPSHYEQAVGFMQNDGDWQASTVVDAPLLFSAELPPGIYELEVEALLVGNADSFHSADAPILGEAAYVLWADLTQAAVVLPGEGDLDGDGDADIADFARFQRAFTGPLPNNP